ncbi:MULTISPECIES: hypothetical protein [unclassified Pseudarthrobacter]|uniref:hypothetical protein n=1 Tax=unclassified Pseudarthrobacter TaxID=2647000 RepID=UPI00363308D5
MKTLRLIKRLSTELPQPARSLWLSIVPILALGFVFLAITSQPWAVRIAMALAGASLGLFGLCVFRDVNGTVTTWNRLYKESRGIALENFTFADVPTLKGLGFLYIVMGLFWIAGSLFAR